MKKQESKFKLNKYEKKKKKKIKTFLRIFGKKHLKNLKIAVKKKLWTLFQKKKEFKEICHLNQRLNSKLPWFFFKPWVKNQKRSLNKQQKYLKSLSRRIQNEYSFKERKDFLKTSFGEILQITHLHAAFWTSGHLIFRQQKRVKRWKNGKRSYIKKVPWGYVTPFGQQYRKLRISMQKGWLYENLLKRNAKHFPLDRPKTAFQTHFTQQKKEPWIDSLLYQRWAYFGFIEKAKKENRKRKLKYKNYLRNWNPRFQKRNQLYWWRRKLLLSSYKKNFLKKRKAQRRQQVIGKIYLPFYGNLKKKQFQKIWKKKKKIKSKFLNRNETILSSLENRLDVVVYRLNLAPNILWARRLIQEGFIFVNNIFSFSSWISVYGQFKYLSFPLKLRDPQYLYHTKFWNPNKTISQFKFLLKPNKKIHYLVQEGDFIQIAKNLSINSMKTNSRLLNKPIPKHLFTIKNTKFTWNNSVKAPESYSSSEWLTPNQQTSALFLFHARFPDLAFNGRIQELYFRWLTS